MNNKNLIFAMKVKYGYLIIEYLMWNDAYLN